MSDRPDHGDDAPRGWSDADPDYQRWSGLGAQNPAEGDGSGWTAPGDAGSGSALPPPTGPAVSGYGGEHGGTYGHPPPLPPSPPLPPGAAYPPAAAPPPGPGGAAQNWNYLAPEDIIRMHKPGIIPLQPLRLGDIFNGALTTIRRNPEATIGLALVVLLAVLIPSGLISLGLYQLSSISSDDAAVLALLAPTLASSLGTLTLSGFVIYVVSEAALGDKVGIGQTWRAVRSRLIPLILVTIITALMIVAGFIILFVLALVGAFGTDWGGAAAFIVMMIAMIPLAFWLFAKVALAPAVVVLERAGPFRAIGRAWKLSRGGQAWRILGIYLLSSIVASIFAQIIAIPLSIGIGAATAAIGADNEFVVLVIGMHLSSLMVDALVTPFTAGVLALLYLDMRFRREGLDTTLMQSAQRRAAARRGGA